MGMATVATDNRAPQVREFGPAVLLAGPVTVRALRQQWYLVGCFLVAFLETLLISADLVGGTFLLMIVVGLPVLLFGFVFLRKVSDFERRRMARATGMPMVSPYRGIPDGGPLVKLLAHVSDPATWRDGAYMLVTGFFGLGWFVAVVCTWILLAGAVALPFVLSGFEKHNVSWMGVDCSNHSCQLQIDGLLGVGGSDPMIAMPAALLYGATVFAVVWLLSAPLLELMTRVQFAIGNGLLGLSRTELARREAAMRVSRGQAVSAAETERRRIERDLHDGAQQRLVALAMDLGMAKSKLGNKDATAEDQAAAARLVTEAHEGVKLALSELRDLARGIHPAVLTDRGLDAALSALAARSPIPVVVDAALTWRPIPEIESAAYFVASEALANMAKHSHAAHAWIELEHRNGALCMTVGDDGVGGAEVGGGTGLSGLSDRIAPLDGILSVSSPIGGPTLIVMEIPCQPPLGY